jgi:plasmid stabilization system protein ParE
MSLPVVLRRDASKDAEQARDYFESQRTGLGQKFVDRLREALGRIGDFPKAYAVVWRNVRAIRLRRFTYVVFYRVLPDRVEVFSIVDGRRDSSVWKSRTSS